MNKDELKEIMEPILESLGYEKFNWEEVKVDKPSDHKTQKLVENEIAVYMFNYGDNKYLKIGKVGENSNPRFLYHHYNPNSCKSNLAKQLIDDNEHKYGKEWEKLKENYIKNEKYKNNKGEEKYIEYENARNDIGDWIRKNTSRTNIYLKLSDNNFGKYKYFILSLFESALQCKFKPRYENNIHEKSI